ncbi:hypothetical protein PR048_017791 [Dryococelus australis]|uniref:Uncharacterized protein n=1 Tax=Dryococelus australis TaxID=614101 RepID=A0ABQ9HAH9_9NEOP|nr:hypothetical protein PR048_017791 [Dryococelus australis]
MEIPCQLPQQWSPCRVRSCHRYWLELLRKLDLSQGQSAKYKMDEMVVEQQQKAKEEGTQKCQKKTSTHGGVSYTPHTISPSQSSLLLGPGSYVEPMGGRFCLTLTLLNTCKSTVPSTSLTSLVGWAQLSLSDDEPRLSPIYIQVRGCGGVVVKLLAFHLGEPGSIPGGVAPRFSHVGIVPDDAAVRWVFSGISCLPHPSFRRCSIYTSLHAHRLSRDLAVKSRPSVISHSL